MTKVLIVEDDVAFALMLRTWLSKNGYEAESVVSAEQAVKRMGECVFDVVLSDLRLPDRDGITLLEWIRHKSPHSEVIIMTGYANVSTAVAAIKLGAFDYLEKPVNPEILREKMTAAVMRHEQRRSRPETQSASEPGTAIVWGHSEASAKLRDHLLLVAPTNMSVLITGESGTGKEVITNQIYQASKRFGKPFLKVNCAAIPDTLMESELFGYEPGAFTGASKSGKTGIFELANGGTLMLDEIGEMSVQMQTKLLRVLQNHEITKIGGHKAIPVDVRIIAATNKNLLQCIEEHTFREDLYYRLNVVPIQLVPLRERKSDIEVLFYHFFEKYTKKYNKPIEIYSDALHLLENYNWPGNIRELENVTERLVVINQNNIIDKKTVALVLGIRDTDSYAHPEDEYNLKASTIALEKHIIEKALTTFHTKRKAATALGIDHSTLVKKCQRYGI